MRNSRKLLTAVVLACTVSVTASAAAPSSEEFEKTIEKGLALDGCNKEFMEVITEVFHDLHEGEYLVIALTQPLADAKEGLIAGAFRNRPSQDQLKSLVGRKICNNK